MTYRMLKFGILSLGLLLVGCASNIPKPIRTPVPHNPDLIDVRGNIDHYSGQRVRWGGTIASVHTGKSASTIEIVQHSLNQNGRPRETDHSAGRFLARVDTFLDPVIYAEGREITVTGHIHGKDVHKIGDYNYKYPVVDVQNYHLWQRQTTSRTFYTPFYDPFYGPFYEPFGFDSEWAYPRGRFFRLHGGY